MRRAWQVRGTVDDLLLGAQTTNLHAVAVGGCRDVEFDRLARLVTEPVGVALDHQRRGAVIVGPHSVRGENGQGKGQAG